MNEPAAADVDAVRALLGREPDGAFEVVVRDAQGAPVVIRNAPVLHDGTPMPTLYWLVGRAETQAVSRIEARGGVRRAEAECDADEVAAAHARYAAERDRLIGHDHAGPRPAGGVGGTRQGVKCLHAHYAWHLAGGDDPVGRWVSAELAGCLRIDLGAEECAVELGATRRQLPVGTAQLRRVELRSDPPRPEELTNALGAIADHLDDLVRELPAALGSTVVFGGPDAVAVAAIEAGGPLGGPFRLARAAAEDVFRTVATEAAPDRARNPGLPGHLVDTVVAGCCIVVAVMRHLHLDEVTVVPHAAVTGSP